MPQFNSDIRQRVLFLSLIPMLVITCILGFFFTYTQLNYARTGLLEKGQELSELLSAAAEFGILSNNAAELRPLSHQLMQNPLVIDVLFMDRDMNIIYREDTFELTIGFPPEPSALVNQHWYFSHPVKPTPIRTDNVPELFAEQTSIETVGWVTLIFSDEPIRQQQLLIIRNSLFIIFSGFLITFSISSYFGRKISQPIKQLSDIITQLRRGNLGVRAPTSQTDEFNQLGEGINELAKSLEQSNRHMETRITQATQALSVSLQELERKNQQLVRAHEKADSANRAKDAFLARMSHELRTPLTSVIGFTRMIQEGSGEQERAHYLKIVDHTSQMLLTLIDDLLDFTRLESDALELETIEFHPEQLIHQALEMQAPAAHSKGIELIFSGGFNLPIHLSGDPTRIRQIITNLIGNAIKFTETGHIVLHTEYQPDKHILTLSVSDTGIGISPEYKSKMFDSFTQADNSISRRYGGSGLGLAIVYRLVKLMRGNIEVRSEPDKGTTFDIQLPLTSETELFSIDLIDDFSIKTTTAEYSIAVVEKNVASRKNLLELFEHYGYPCRVSERLEDILSTEEPISHILLSHSVLEEDTDLLLRQTESLRQRFPGVKLILLLPANFRWDCLKKIKASILNKPVSPTQVLTVLEYPEQQEQGKDYTNYQLNKLEILIAEDNDYNRLLIKRILKQAGISSREVVTGAQAIKAVSEKMPDIVLMDINMPDMDGIEASRQILDQHPNTNIIALTANISSREQQLLNQLGINKILIKPLNIEKLYALLSTLDIKKPTNAVEKSAASWSNLEFEEEIERQLKEIQSRIYAKDYAAIGRNAHQLHGFAGLFDHPEIENIAHQLRKAVISRDIRKIWSVYNQLARVVKGMRTL
ncbi:ATP-binding protein [Nitrincola sp.]|uniref:hybrid sensor histidine kinase/response regulator n=1 Tax=Nitrincola sp. TaxID=1926584 RepID=UPI003A8CE8C7